MISKIPSNFKPESKLVQGEQIDGVVLSKLENHNDNRGWFREIFVSDDNCIIQPEQWSLVQSNKNVLRGMHCHARHDEFFTLVSGHCLLALQDIRPNRSSYNKFSIYELHESEPASLSFPKGVIHGWYFLENSTHIQAVSESYHSYHKDDNYGCHWQATDLAFEWQICEPIVATRANNFGTVEELKNKLKLR